MAEGKKTLYKFLLEMKAELLIRKRKEETRMFEEEVAIGSIIYAINKVLEKIEDK